MDGSTEGGEPTGAVEPGSGQRACPHCAGTIPAEARVCRHCGYEFETGRVPTSWVPLPEYAQRPAEAGNLAAGIPPTGAPGASVPGAFPPDPSMPSPLGSPAAAPAGWPPSTPVPATNGMAVASLVLGLLWFGGIGSILALVFGYSSKGQIDRSGGAQSGRGLAIAGIVLGWIGVAWSLVLFLLVFGAMRSIQPVGPGL